MFTRDRRSPRNLRAAFAVAVLVAIAGESALPRATGQDTTGDAAARTTPNQSVAIDPDFDDARATADVAHDGRLAPPTGGEPEIAGSEEGDSLPVRTLRPRTAGDSVLGRPDDGDAPWYRSGIGALSIVLAVIVGVFFVLRRFVPAMRAPEGDVLKVVARASLTPKQTLSLVQLGRRFVLVAISAGRVDTLCQVDDTDEVAELMMATGAKFPGRSNPFAAQLRSETANYDGATIPELEDIAGLQEEERGRAVSDLLTRLKKLQRTG
jgi:flagellar biogenesis protein FliO